MNFTIEDVLMYSLELGYPDVVKACLFKLPKDLLSISSICQVRLAVATLPQVIIQSADAAQLISPEHMLNTSQILRSLQFIRSKCPAAGGCKSFCLAALKLKKCIILHYMYNENDTSVLLSHLNEQFHENIVQDMMKPTQNSRVFNILKREVNHFTQLMRKYIKEYENKIRYLQTDVWREFNAQFWQDLHFDVVSYLNAIAAHLPPLKIEKFLQQESSDSEFPNEYINQRIKDSGGIRLNENFLLEFLENITSPTDESTLRITKYLYDTGCNMDENKENNITNDLSSSVEEESTMSLLKNDAEQHIHSESCLKKNFYGSKCRNEITPTCGYSEGLQKETVNKLMLQCPLSTNSKENVKDMHIATIKRTLFSPVENSRPIKRRKLLCAEEAARLLFKYDDLDVENSPHSNGRANSCVHEEDAQVILSFSDSKSTSSINSKVSDTTLHNSKDCEPNSPRQQFPTSQRSKNVLAELNRPINRRSPVRVQTRSHVKSNLPHYVKETPNAALSATINHNSKTTRAVTRSYKKKSRRQLMYNSSPASDTESKSSLTVNEDSLEFDLEPVFTTQSSNQGSRNNAIYLEYKNKTGEAIILESDYSDTESVELSMDPYIPVLSSNLYKDYSIQQQSPMALQKCETRLSRIKQSIRFIDSLGCISVQNVLIQNPGDIECILNE